MWNSSELWNPYLELWFLVLCCTQKFLHLKFTLSKINIRRWARIFLLKPVCAFEQCVMLGASHSKILFVICMDGCEQYNKKSGKILLGHLGGPSVFKNWDSFWLYGGAEPSCPKSTCWIFIPENTGSCWQQQWCKGWKGLCRVTPSWLFLPGFLKISAAEERGVKSPIPFDAIN